jgi:hypothetical protein
LPRVERHTRSGTSASATNFVRLAVGSSPFSIFSSATAMLSAFALSSERSFGYALRVRKQAE